MKESKRPMKSAYVTLEDLEIADLVPGEPLLERASVVSYAARLRAGESLDPPSVVKFGELYYVADGSHRVMAHKLEGLVTLRCAVRTPRKSSGAADFDEDSFRKFLADGFRGFEKVEMVEKIAKEEAYEQEDDELLEGVNGMVLESNVEDSTPVDLDIPDEDFFTEGQ